MIRFFIPVTPRTKKNSMIKTKYGLIQSAAYRQFEKDCLMVIPCEFRNIRISQPCTLTTVFYMKTRHRVDLTNLLSAIHDVLVKAGVIADDNSSIVTSVDGSCVVYRPEQSGIDVIINEVKK